MNYIFAILFIIFSIYFGLRDIKERNLNFKQKLKTFLFYLYFGISMSLFSCFITIEKYISILIFLHLLFIFYIISIIKRKNIYSCIVLLLVLTIGIILIILNYLNLKIHTLLWISLGLSIYFLPVATYLDRKISILRKIKICTTEIEAKIIKVYKSTYNYRKIYIPKFEFYINEKKYNYMNSSEIFSYSKLETGKTVKLFINTNVVLNKTNIDENVLLPNSYYHISMLSGIILFYVITTIIFVLLLFLMLFG